MLGIFTGNFWGPDQDLLPCCKSFYFCTTSGSDHGRGYSLIGANFSSLMSLLTWDLNSLTCSLDQIFNPMRCTGNKLSYVSSLRYIIELPWSHHRYPVACRTCEQSERNMNQHSCMGRLVVIQTAQEPFKKSEEIERP